MDRTLVNLERPRCSNGLCQMRREMEGQRFCYHGSRHIGWFWQTVRLYHTGKSAFDRSGNTYAVPLSYEQCRNRSIPTEIDYCLPQSVWQYSMIVIDIWGM
jgi:hypothetical protein